MPLGKTLFRIPSTGTGDQGRRMDMLEQSVVKFAEDAERAFDAGGKWNLRRLKVNSTAAPWDLILANPTVAAFQILLPDPTTCTMARIKIKNDSTSTNGITLKPFEGKLIDGAATLVMNTSRLVKELFSDGIEWKAI